MPEKKTNYENISDFLTNLMASIEELQNYVNNPKGHNDTKITAAKDFLKNITTELTSCTENKFISGFTITNLGTYLTSATEKIKNINKGELNDILSGFNNRLYNDNYVNPLNIVSKFNSLNEEENKKVIEQINRTIHEPNVHEAPDSEKTKLNPKKL